jgi:hypothetical protein
VLEAEGPAPRHLGDLVGEDADHLLDLLPVDDAAKASRVGVLAGHHHGHPVVEDLNRQVVAVLSEEFLGFLFDHDARAVLRVDDVVSNLEVARRSLNLDVSLHRLM